MILDRLGRYLDDRAGSGTLLVRGFRYVFPDHWTFLFGEIALYCFLILEGTGVYLTFFFEPSSAQVIYDGSYAPLQGQEVSEALSFVRAKILAVTAAAVESASEPCSAI